MVEVGDEAAINLDLVDCQPVQVAEARKSRSKIIDRNSDAKRSQQPDRSFRHFKTARPVSRLPFGGEFGGNEVVRQPVESTNSLVGLLFMATRSSVGAACN